MRMTESHIDHVLNDILLHGRAYGCDAADIEADRAALRQRLLKQNRDDGERVI